jgi:hypothetical protein
MRGRTALHHVPLLELGTAYPLTQTNPASASQCLGCGLYPFRILPAYQRDTPIRDRIAAVEMFASSGWTFRENSSLVSQAGCFDASHDERALECLRWESASFAKASGICAAACPSRDAIASRSVAGLMGTGHNAQNLVVSDAMLLQQRRSGLPSATPMRQQK